MALAKVRRMLPSILIPCIGVFILINATVAGFSMDAAQQVEVTNIPDSVWNEMVGQSWHKHAPGCRGNQCSCPPRTELRLLRIPYVDYSGQLRIGRMVVHQSAAKGIASVFAELLKRHFPISKIELVDAYGGSDHASMSDNNTSGFNCRVKTSGKGLSKHSFGTAVDINPIENPYVRGESILPPSGKPYAYSKNRLESVKGLIVAGGPVEAAFRTQGWKWGGEWKSSKDYQHFSDDGN